MAVGSASFGNAQAFQDLIKKAHTYQKQEPSAASAISGEKKPNTGAKIGVGLAVTAIAVAAGLVAGAKTGVFNFETIKNNNLVKNLYEKMGKPEGLKNFGKTALEFMDNAGNKIAKVGKDIIEKVKTILPKVKDAE